MAIHEKYDQPDTILPGKYKPYYPNSWWRYVDQNGDTVIKRTSSSYSLYTYRFTRDAIPYYFAAYAPEYDNTPYFGYSIATTNDISPIFSETDDTLKIYDDLGYYAYQMKTNLSRTVNSITYNNVIRDTRFYIYNHLGNGPYQGTYFYAPDVGLIEYYFDLIPSDTIPPIESLHLIDYHIGPH